MTDPIRTCEDHGAFATGDEECPVCGARGVELLSGDRRRRLSKFMSGALRHFPDDVGLELNERGWTAYDALRVAAERKYGWVRPAHVAAVIETDPKGRFERTDAPNANTDTGLVRAAYGHSVDITLEPTDTPVPDELYHGTAPENLESIRDSGLRPMSRQHVHLSESRGDARHVGRRHANEPVVLVVDAAAMLADGNRITKRGAQTYTTERVPPKYLTAEEESTTADT